MYLIDQYAIDDYLKDDRTARWLDQFSEDGDEALVCQRWLRQTAPKRAIWSHLYGDLLEPGECRRVLDVGGGITALSAELARRHDYLLVDLLAHDDLPSATGMACRAARDFIFPQDWYNLEPSQYDLVVANDIFPNVDQRLELFLKLMLPQTRRLRLSLTFYESPRFYITRRVDADEILCMLAWNSEQLRHTLEKYAERIVGYDACVFDRQPASVYPNGRQVCVAEMRGDLESSMGKV